MHNNDGNKDTHSGLNNGNINIDEVLDLIDNYCINPSITVEVNNSKEIDELVINIILGMDLFNPRQIPNSFIDEIVLLDAEDRKDVIQECQSDIARLLFDKNGRRTFWHFFGRLLSYADAIREERPGDIEERIRREKIAIPRKLSRKSVVYLISALKEGLNDDN